LTDPLRTHRRTHIERTHYLPIHFVLLAEIKS